MIIKLVTFDFYLKFNMKNQNQNEDVKSTHFESEINEPWLDIPTQSNSYSDSELHRDPYNLKQKVSKRARKSESFTFESMVLPLPNFYPKDTTTTEVQLPTLQHEKVCRPWTLIEETFLIGIVFDTLFLRGSLAPTSQQKLQNNTSWTLIKNQFDKAIVRHYYLMNTNIPNSCYTRTLFALKRHFKVMKMQVEKEEVSEETLPVFKQLFFTWNTKYNQNNILTCSEVMFKNKIKTNIYQ